MGISKEFYESFTKTYEPCTLFHGIKDRNSEKFSSQGLSAYLTLNLTDFENSIISFFFLGDITLAHSSKTFALAWGIIDNSVQQV